MKLLPVVINQLPAETDEQVCTESDVEALLREIEELQVTLDQRTKQIADFSMKLNSEHHDLVNRIITLEAELQSYLTEEVASNDKKADDEDVAQLRSDVESEDDGDDVESEELTKEQMQKACAGLFRLIARKTHPDVVGNDSKTSIFLEAKEALGRLDLVKLETLLEELSINFATKLVDRLRSLEYRRAQLQSEIAAVDAHELSPLLRLDYYYGYPVASREYRTQLQNLLNTLERQIAEHKHGGTVRYCDDFDFE